MATTTPHNIPAEVEIDHDQQQHNNAMDEMLSAPPAPPNQQATEPKHSQPPKNPEVARTDPQEPKSNKDTRGSGVEEDDDPRNPLSEFNWNDFEARYRQAMVEANDGEQALRDDFNGLVQYFGVWASAASQYDNDRSQKRIKTRTLYVQHAEESLEQKKMHYTRVVEAFQNALSLLGNS